MAIFEMDLKWICILDGLSTHLKIQVSCRLFSFVINPLEPISKHTNLHENPRDMMSCTRDEYFSLFLSRADVIFVSKGTVNSPIMTDLLAELTITRSGLCTVGRISGGTVPPLIM